MQKRNIAVLALAMGFVTYALTRTAGAQEPTMSTQSDSVRTLFRFEDRKSGNRWVAINDNVMGGISDGEAAITEDSCLLFKGWLSLENNGGFASIRTLFADFDLSGFTGIRIRVKGDGRLYQFRLRLDSDMDGIAYKREFQTVANSWMEIDMPFESFQASYRGRVLHDADPLVAADIRQMGFLISDKIEGEFRLLVDQISAYK